MRPCASCHRHVATDAGECPFCGVMLPLSHRLPSLPAVGEPRPAPKYGGPPLTRPSTWIGCALVLGVLSAALAISFLLLQ